MTAPSTDPLTRAPLNSTTASVLKSVILAKVIPQISAATQGVIPTASKRAAELAELLIAVDETAARELIDELRAHSGTSPMLYARLFEPAARALGDLWTEDLCSEFDVTLGLFRLQNAIRLLALGRPTRLGNRVTHPVVLIAPAPGDLHRLGAAMDGEILRDAGWSPHCEYPANDQALQDMLSSRWVDVLDLLLSAAFRREHWLARVTETITRARRASQNPDLLVMVGGRVFAEDRTAGARVGADLSSTSIFGVDRSILRILSAARTRAPVPLASLDVIALPA